VKISLRLISILVPLTVVASARGETTPQVINILYSISVTSKDMLEIAAYNPSELAACTSYLNWPGPNDNVRVIGRDGKEWQYIGLTADPVGRPESVRIAPHSEATVTLDLRKNYKPVSKDARIGSVYYGAVFRSC